MSMLASERSALLSLWIKPSSEDEQLQQDRAERMVTDAVTQHPTLSSAELRVYPKGSYANNTNVRRDSDVDIVVQSCDCEYYDYMPGQVPSSPSSITPYQGEWTPQ